MRRSLIVCAVDQSAVAGSTVARALALAAWQGSDLHLVHVRPRPSALALRAPIERPLPELAADEAWLTGLVQQAKQGGVGVRHVLYRGDPASAIVEHARSMAADLIVLGRRPFSPLLRRYRGSIAKAVARAAACPVLVVPAAADGIAQDASVLYRQVVCPVDFSPPSLTALRYAARLAQESGGCLHPIHVLDRIPNEPVISGGRASRFLREYEALRVGALARLDAAIPSEVRDWCDVVPRVAGGIPSSEVLKLASEVRADLIVMGVQRRSVMDQIVSGTTLPAVLRRASCSVMTVPAPVEAAPRLVNDRSSLEPDTEDALVGASA